jgi:hypothetical protein
MSPLLLPIWIATAQADDPSLAVPFDAAAPAERPLAVPGRPPDAAAESGMSSAERLNALRQYQRQRLSINPEIQLYGGGTRVYSSVGFGFGFPGFGTGVVVTDPIQTARTHGAYQGAQWLTVPDFLAEAGASNLQRQLNTDIETAQRRSRLFYLAAGVGVAGLVASSYGARTARSAEQYYFYGNMVLPSLGVTVGGLLAGAIPAAQAERLRRYPTESIGIDQAQELADGHNEELRQSLGLQPEDVWQLEAAEPPTR